MGNGEFEMGVIGEGFIEKMTFTQREEERKQVTRGSGVRILIRGRAIATLNQARAWSMSGTMRLVGGGGQRGHGGRRISHVLSCERA